MCLCPLLSRGRHGGAGFDLAGNDDAVVECVEFMGEADVRQGGIAMQSTRYSEIRYSSITRARLKYQSPEKNPSRGWCAQGSAACRLGISPHVPLRVCLPRRYILVAPVHLFCPKHQTRYADLEPLHARFALRLPANPPASLARTFQHPSYRRRPAQLPTTRPSTFRTLSAVNVYPLAS